MRPSKYFQHAHQLCFIRVEFQIMGLYPERDVRKADFFRHGGWMKEKKLCLMSIAVIEEPNRSSH